MPDTLPLHPVVLVIFAALLVAAIVMEVHHAEVVAHIGAPQTLVGVIIATLATGKTAVLQGVVHLVIFAAYLFLVFQR